MFASMTRAACALLLSLCAAGTATATDMVECAGCQTDEMRELTALARATDRYYFDLGAGTLRRFQASGCNSEGSNWMLCVRETAPWHTAQNLFAEMQALERADPGFFAKRHVMYVPIERLGGSHDPVAISVLGTGTPHYQAFRAALDSLLSNPQNIAGPNHPIATWLDFDARSTSWGFSWFFSVESSPGTQGPSWDITFYAPNADYLRVIVAADGSWTYEGSYDMFDYRYPSPETPDSGNFPYGVIGEEHANRVRRAQGLARLPWGTQVSYMSCAYAGGRLIGCTIYP